jgi:hypothetical protein
MEPGVPYTFGLDVRPVEDADRNWVLRVVLG